MEKRTVSLIVLRVLFKIKEKDLTVPPVKRHVLAISILLIAVSCATDSGIVLTIDFSGRTLWRYCLEAGIDGAIASADTQRTFSSAARCTLSGSPDPSRPGLFHATVGPVHMTSNILSAEEIENLKEQARGMRFTCSLQDGTIAPDDSSLAPFVKIGEWDIFKDLAKTVPALPRTKVRKGSTWDRERTIPLETKHGNAAGHLFQSFSLDSVYKDRKNKTYAVVRWRFSYQIEPRTPDTAGYLDKLPSKGAGSGMALVDVSDKALQNASVNFTVPSASEGMFRISWKESISLRLVQ
jgi:hypothetical protein